MWDWDDRVLQSRYYLYILVWQLQFDSVTAYPHFHFSLQIVLWQWQCDCDSDGDSDSVTVNKTVWKWQCDSDNQFIVQPLSFFRFKIHDAHYIYTNWNLTR